MPIRKPIPPGEKFFRLTVISEAPSRIGSKGQLIYSVNAKCDCGNILSVAEYKLRAKTTKSCGCWQRDLAPSHLPKPKHSMSRTTEYNIWTGIKQRCTNSKHSYFKYYGGKGIKICDRWLNSFQNFYNDMGPRPSEGHSIDRIKTSGDYEPSNCKWSTWDEQHRNKTNNRNVVINGVTMCVSQAVKLIDTHESKVIRMVQKLKITHQQAIDLLMLKPRPVNMRQFKTILDKGEITK